jgi:hypothetical protein
MTKTQETALWEDVPEALFLTIRQGKYDENTGNSALERSF